MPYDKKLAWRGDRRVAGMTPDQLNDELNVIREKYGELTNHAVVEEARSPDHPLHGEFDWDDARVAHHARCRIAGEIINSITEVTFEVTVETVYTSPSPPLPKLVAAPGPTGSTKYGGSYYVRPPGAGGASPAVPYSELTDEQRDAVADRDRRWALGQIRNVLDRVGYLRNHGYAEAVEYLELSAKGLDDPATESDAAE